MSMKIFELNREKERAIKRAEALVTAAETEKRTLTALEDVEYESLMQNLREINRDITAIQSKNTIADMFDPKTGMPKAFPGGAGAPPFRNTLSADYKQAFAEYVASGGRKIGAALYEGSNSGGGYAVPIVVDSLIVPLAPAEIGVREISTVIPTSSDVKIPQKSAFGSGVGFKTESGSSTHVFAESDPSLSQFTLSAFMLGGVDSISFELAQDVPLFQQFCIDDLLKSIAVFEDTYFVTGSGTGQPQGLIGNTGAGVTGVLVGTDNYASELQAALFDVIGKLNAVYHPGASWLMNRTTAAVLRKQQMQSNLFAPLWTRVGNRDYLLGYPVQYSAAMPDIAASATPVLFGDFKAGYVIGDRGGSSISLKILDQPLATQGQIQLLAYERVDGRVRRSEAIQAITLHS